MIKYVFRQDEPLIIKAGAKANPQKIGEALAKVAEASNGKLTPEATVEAARDKKSALHAHFEWDDKVAAQSHRLDQARNLIRVIRVESIEADGEPARAFQSISDKGGVAYRSVQEIQGSMHLSELLLAAADRDLEAFQKRHRALVDVCSIVQKARDAVAAKRASKNETRAAA